MTSRLARSPLRPILLGSTPALLLAFAIASAGPACAGPGAPQPTTAASLVVSRPAQPPETVLAYVEGIPVTRGYLTAADEDVGPLLNLQGRQREAYLLDYVIDSILVARFAERNKLDKAANFARRFDYERTKLLVRGVLDEIAARVTSEAAMRDATGKAQGELIQELRKTATIERFSPAAKN